MKKRCIAATLLFLAWTVVTDAGPKPTSKKGGCNLITNGSFGTTLPPGTATDGFFKALPGWNRAWGDPQPNVNIAPSPLMPFSAFNWATLDVVPDRSNAILAEVAVDPQNVYVFQCSLYAYMYIPNPFGSGAIGNPLEAFRVSLHDSATSGFPQPLNGNSVAPIPGISAFITSPNQTVLYAQSVGYTIQAVPEFIGGCVAPTATYDQLVLTPIISQSNGISGAAMVDSVVLQKFEAGTVDDVVVDCIEPNVKIVPTCPLPTPTVQYSWAPAAYFDDPNSASPTLISGPSNGGSQTCTMTVTCGAYTDSTTFTVTSTTPPFTYAASPSIICENDFPITLTGPSPIGQTISGLTYNWYLNGAFHSSTSSSSNLVISEPGTYVVEVYDGNCLLNQQTIVAQAYLVPHLSFDWFYKPINVGDNVFFIMSLGLPQIVPQGFLLPTVSWDWVFTGPSSIATSTDNNPATSYSAAGIFPVTLNVQTANCGTYSITKYVTVQ